MADADMTAAFPEANLRSVPIRDLHLTIADTPLEPILAEFEGELKRAGIVRVQPRFYLSTEWGVPFDTVAVAIPFYLAREELTELQAEKAGLVEGVDKADILRYLRHEMGHVINYAYRLYDEPEWVRLFGSIDQPYEDDYRPQPFSHRFVRHLPGWYAQKHPDEDWAETFAVWMTPNRDWRSEYANWPEALAKLEYCDQRMKDLSERDPVVTDDARDEDVGDLEYSLEKYYGNLEVGTTEALPGVDGSLRSIFEEKEPEPDGTRVPASSLLKDLENVLMTDVFRWTGHSPERTRLLVRQLATRADALHLVYRRAQEQHVRMGVAVLVTALAMNYVHRGSYTP